MTLTCGLAGWHPLRSGAYLRARLVELMEGVFALLAHACPSQNHCRKCRYVLRTGAGDGLVGYSEVIVTIETIHGVDSLNRSRLFGEWLPVQG